jgi:hypothetical protein
MGNLAHRLSDFIPFKASGRANVKRATRPQVYVGRVAALRLAGMTSRWTTIIYDLHGRDALAQTYEIEKISRGR